MLKPFRQFMEGLIDYAGLFPPATLTMDKAIRNYAKFRQSSEAWMLGRFICPATRLSELEPYKAILFPNGESWRFSVLGKGGATEKEFLKNLREDLMNISAFKEFQGERVIVDAFEVRLPQKLIASGTSAEIARFLNRVAEVIEQEGPPELTVAYEGGFPENWPSRIGVQVMGLAEHNRYISGSGSFRHYQPALYKIRCGGVEAHHYPTPEQVARVLLSCLTHHQAFKATAGLHHPVRHFNRSAGVKMHGFLNVFGAAIIALAHNLEYEQILEIILD